MTYRELLLPPESVAGYLDDRLAQGYNLGRFLLRHFNTRKGQARTWGPGEPTCIDLQEGGFTSLRESVHWLAQDIREFLMAGSDKVCVFENAVAGRRDPGLSRVKSQLFFFEENVYHYLTAQDTAIEAIENTILEANSAWLSIGVLSVCPEMKQVGLRSKLESVSILEQVAIGTIHIIVSAYDGEGYIISGVPK
jgi:hypothetical protein